MCTLNDQTDGRLKEAIHLSRKLADKSLIECLRALKRIDKNLGTTTMIMNDFATFSFEFVRRDAERNFRGNGGIIFHGAGNEYRQNMAIQMNPTQGWSIHT